MRRTLGWLAGALGAAGALKALRDRRRPAPKLLEPGPDPRAEALRRRLEEAKPAATDLPVAGPAAAEETEPDPEAKRRGVHDRARAAIEEMRRPDETG